MAKPKRSPQKRNFQSRRSSRKKTSTRKVGNEEIYPHQEEAASRALNILRLNETDANPRTPVIVMQPQSGKTGCVMALIDDFVDYCESNRDSLQKKSSAFRK